MATPKGQLYGITSCWGPSPPETLPFPEPTPKISRTFPAQSWQSYWGCPLPPPLCIQCGFKMGEWSLWIPLTHFRSVQNYPENCHRNKWPQISETPFYLLILNLSRSSPLPSLQTWLQGQATQFNTKLLFIARGSNQNKRWIACQRITCGPVSLQMAACLTKNSLGL